MNYWLTMGIQIFTLQFFMVALLIGIYLLRLRDLKATLTKRNWTGVLSDAASSTDQWIRACLGKISEVTYE